MLYIVKSTNSLPNISYTMADDMKPCFAIEAVPQQKKEKRLQFVSVYWNNSFSKLGFLKKKKTNWPLSKHDNENMPWKDHNLRSEAKGSFQVCYVGV